VLTQQGTCKLFWAAVTTAAAAALQFKGLTGKAASANTVHCAEAQSRSRFEFFSKCLRRSKQSGCAAQCQQATGSTPCHGVTRGQVNLAATWLGCRSLGVIGPQLTTDRPTCCMNQHTPAKTPIKSRLA
jgi:hypothetical protein